MLSLGTEFDLLCDGLEVVVTNCCEIHLTEMNLQDMVTDHAASITNIVDDGVTEIL